MRRSRHAMARWLAALSLLPGVAAGQVPADAGQVWKTYDLAPFVQAAGAGSEKYVVDWILQETGYPAWHAGKAASLSAAAGQLSCFHDAEMQARVATVVERFVAEADNPHRFAVRLLAFDTPAWRTEARPALQPIEAATPGVQAWILSREAAAVVVARMRARGDVAELPTGPVLAGNGVPASLTGGRRQAYVEDFAPRPAPPGWEPRQAACDEGLAIDIQPLVSRDAAVVDAVFRCRIDQIERLVPVSLPAPAGGPAVAAQVPQVAAVRIGERFRWPANQTLLIALGLVPWPVPAQNNEVVEALIPMAERRDVVVVVEPRLGGRSNGQRDGTP